MWAGVERHGHGQSTWAMQCDALACSFPNASTFKVVAVESRGARLMKL